MTEDNRDAESHERELELVRQLGEARADSAYLRGVRYGSGGCIVPIVAVLVAVGITVILVL